MTRLSYKERAKRRREQEILLSARQLIQADGAAQLNMECLAQAVGISKPTLYQHFKSKEDLLARVLVENIMELDTFLQSTTEPSPLMRLKMALRLALVNRYARDGLLTGFESDVLNVAMHAHEAVAAAKQQVLARTTRLVEEGKARGEIDPSVPTLMVGCMLVKLIGLPGIVMQMAAQFGDQYGTPSGDASGSAPDDQQDLDRIIDDVVALFERAIVPREQPGTASQTASNTLPAREVTR